MSRQSELQLPSLWLFDVWVTGDVSRQKADEALLLHHRGPVCERPLAGAALPGESQPRRLIQASEKLQRSTCLTLQSDRPQLSPAPKPQLVCFFLVTVT